MSTPKNEPADCLVAVVRNDADLRRFLEEHTYRIPVASIGRAISQRTLDGARTLALYQTGDITRGLCGAIEYSGRIDSVELLTRRRIIPDEPDHPFADRPYHLLHLGEITRLIRPVFSSRPRRITFLRTSARRLAEASGISDLIIGPETEEKLWTELRGHKAERKLFMRVGEEMTELDFAIFRSGRALGIICDDDRSADSATDVDGVWRVLRFSRCKLDAEFAACVERIRREVEALHRGSG